MAESAYTKGPWSAKSGRIEAKDRLIASMLSANSRTTQEDKANARLIASAPDLVAELKRDLAYVREMKAALKTMGWTNTVQFTSTEMREKGIAAALSRALGKEG